ncbi:hypothetical protein [Actinotignum urinale]|uniref:Toxin-antitoxin system YwqK family antitoxin n=1 Tax=Actinotignum urinale TaxID=190146 RepID=A0ABU5GBU8_9ACTO|nr:hypothetical protein [Actinotignum urinale]MDY5133556.1 hypothetical protein [Actinotignum urinale]
MTTEPTKTYYPNGNIEYIAYTVDGQLHRDGAPAEINYDPDGIIAYEAYWQHGQLHRDGAPALINYRENGNIWREQYWHDGRRHREDGPAEIYYNKDGKITCEAYYRDGQLHREDAPAVINYDPDGTTRSEYWRDGTSYTPGVRDVKNTLQEKLEKIEKQRAQLTARAQRIRAKYAAKERKARTRRLIQVGAILESNLGIEFTEEKRNQLARFLHHKYDNGITGAQRVLEQISRESAEPIS